MLRISVYYKSTVVSFVTMSCVAIAKKITLKNSIFHFFRPLERSRWFRFWLVVSWCGTGTSDQFLSLYELLRFVWFLITNDDDSEHLTLLHGCVAALGVECYVWQLRNCDACGVFFDFECGFWLFLFLFFFLFVFSLLYSFW